jgi:hypothetical protein
MIRDVLSGSGGQKAPDPGSGSATLEENSHPNTVNGRVRQEIPHLPLRTFQVILY